MIVQKYDPHRTESCRVRSKGRTHRTRRSMQDRLVGTNWPPKGDLTVSDGIIRVIPVRKIPDLIPNLCRSLVRDRRWATGPSGPHPIWSSAVLSHRVLKLTLTAGAFSVLLDPATSQTCYTDFTGTSRTAYATPEALLAFANSVIEQLGFAPASGQRLA